MKILNKGFTLVEVMVAMALLSIIAVGFLPAFGVMSKSSMMSDQITNASVTATNTMEQLYNAAQGSTYTQLRGKITNLSDLGFNVVLNNDPYQYSKVINGFTVKVRLDSTANFLNGTNGIQVFVDVFAAPADVNALASEQTIMTLISLL